MFTWFVIFIFGPFRVVDISPSFGVTQLLFNWYQSAGLVLSSHVCAGNWGMRIPLFMLRWFICTHFMIALASLGEFLPWTLKESFMVVAKWSDHTGTHFHSWLGPLRLTQPDRNVVIAAQAGSPAAMVGATLSINSFTVQQARYMRNRSAFNWSCGECPDRGSVRRAVCLTSWLN